MLSGVKDRAELTSPLSSFTMHPHSLTVLVTSCCVSVLKLLFNRCFLGFTVSLSPEDANQFLRRHRRANQVFEETKQGHLERECVEERCSKEEAREVFENDPETVQRLKFFFYL